MNEPLRCFVALPVPEAVAAQLEAVVGACREAPWAEHVRWLAPETFHVTLSFLGKIAGDGVPAIARALDACAGRAAPFDLDLGAPVWLPSSARARVVVAPIGPSAPLEALFEDLCESLAGLGYARERRRFRPHVTLGRVRRPPLRGKVELPAEPGGWEVRELLLMRSHLERSGARYEALHRALLD